MRDEVLQLPPSLLQPPQPLPQLAAVRRQRLTGCRRAGHQRAAAYRPAARMLPLTIAVSIN
jgi:hypothetical protein